MDQAQLLSYTPPPDLLRDRVILVTGASDGIGRQVAMGYAAHGATVVLLSKTLPKLEQVYDAIDAAGGSQPAIYPMNLESATPQDYEDLAHTLEQEFGRLDGLLNNAGWVSGLTPLAQYDIERWARVMTVNLHAPFLLTRALLRLLEQSSDPAVLFSTHECTRAFWGAYGVAKHGVEGLMRMFAAEHAGERFIRFNGIDTGPVRTGLWTRNYPGRDAESLPPPETFLGPYLYLIGPDAGRISGQNFEFQAP